MGNALRDQDKLEEAIEAYKKAISIKPDFADVYYNIGNALRVQGKHEEAVEAYKKAISIKPDFAEAHHEIGNALRDQGKLEEAIEAYKKEYKLNSGYSKLLLSQTLQLLGNYEEAIDVVTWRVNQKSRQFEESLAG